MADESNGLSSAPEIRINGMLGPGSERQTAPTVATAESCTGGGVAARLTSIAGASDYVLGGIVSYSNEAKAKLPRKPVGLVYIALASADGVQCEEFHFPGGRAVVVDAATEAALLMLLRGIEKRLEE